jgi:hypothetical protein
MLSLSGPYSIENGIIGGRDSAGGVATSYGQDSRVVGVRVPVGATFLPITEAAWSNA